MNRLLFAWMLLLTAVLLSCLKAVTYPKVPTLAFKSFQGYADSAVIKFEFTDGDGNFGINSTEVQDTSSPFHGCLKSFNMLLEYYEYQGNSWVHFPRDPCAGDVAFYYTVPWIEPTGQNKTQKGEIKIVIAPDYYFPGTNDSCRFEAHILDRDFQASNVVTTPVFLKR
jgi:hypothetical protein